jgi:hypothetical protein
LNALAGGDENTTISSRLALNYPNSKVRKTVDYLFAKVFRDYDHCEKALQKEIDYKFNQHSIIK